VRSWLFLDDFSVSTPSPFSSAIRFVRFAVSRLVCRKRQHRDSKSIIGENAGVIIGHRTPRERCSAADHTSLIPFCPGLYTCGGHLFGCSVFTFPIGPFGHWSCFDRKEKSVGTWTCKELRIANFASRKYMQRMGHRLALKLHIRRASAIGACGWGCIALDECVAPVSPSFLPVGPMRHWAMQRESRCKCLPLALQVVRDSSSKPLKPQALPFGRQFAEGVSRTNAREGDQRR